MERQPCYTFTATNYVHSMSIGSPVIIRPSDTVNVLGWFCNNGPTAFTVNGSSYGVNT